MILKIQKGFEDAGMKAPLFEEDCGGVRVTLYRNVKCTLCQGHFYKTVQ